MSYWNRRELEDVLVLRRDRIVRRRRIIYSVIQVLTLFTSFLLLLYPIWMHFNYIQPNYYNAIGQHIDQVMTNNEHPELIITYVELAKDGIPKLGLEPDDNSALFHNNENSRVSKQYEIFDYVISRCNIIINWRNEYLAEYSLENHTIYVGMLDDLYRYMINCNTQFSPRGLDYITFGAYVNKEIYSVILYRFWFIHPIHIVIALFIVYYFKNEKRACYEVVTRQIRSETNVTISSYRR